MSLAGSRYGRATRLLGVLCRRCHRPWTVLLVVVALHMATTEEGSFLRRSAMR
jgi:hypothetical protein